MGQASSTAGHATNSVVTPSQTMPGGLTTGRSLGLGVLAGVGASLCCLPIVLVLLGAGGAWMGTFTAMEPYRPIFIGLTLVFLGLAFRKLYLMPRACLPGKSCADLRLLKRQRTIFWVVTALLGALVGFPWYLPYVLG